MVCQAANCDILADGVSATKEIRCRSYMSCDT